MALIVKGPKDKESEGGGWSKERRKNRMWLSFYSIRDSNFVSSLSPKIAVLGMGSGIQCIFASKYVFRYMKTGYIE